MRMITYDSSGDQHELADSEETPAKMAHYSKDKACQQPERSSEQRHIDEGHDKAVFDDLQGNCLRTVFVDDGPTRQIEAHAEGVKPQSAEEHRRGRWKRSSPA